MEDGDIRNNSPYDSLSDDVVHALNEIGSAGAEGIGIVDGAVGGNDEETWNSGDAPVLCQFLALLFVGNELLPLRFVLRQLLVPCVDVVVDGYADEL